MTTSPSMYNVSVSGTVETKLFIDGMEMRRTALEAKLKEEGAVTAFVSLKNLRSTGDKFDDPKSGDVTIELSIGGTNADDACAHARLLVDFAAGVVSGATLNHPHPVFTLSISDTHSLGLTPESLRLGIDPLQPVVA